MFKNQFKKKKLGFTLVEMLISMAIFMAFTGILISSYTGIIRSQRDANEYRDMYVQARQVMETLVQNLRDGMLDYGYLAKNNAFPEGEVHFVSRDGQTKTYVNYENDIVKLRKRYLMANNLPCDTDNTCYGPEKDAVNLNDPTLVKVTKFQLYFSPKVDPYDLKNVAKDTSQFQPRVTVYAQFEKDLKTGGKYTMDLQTTVSSRVYSQVYSTDYQYTNDKFSY
ncbi:type II secretion system protein [Candidatus Peregrinibacteria bacterium]|nr:type II secretion system protein [Candidatus Peregrinibacteria bacterium]